ncbi:MAG: metal ABC transporter permease [Micavibrio sp.]|nr:metal ABC transporter permease [Micavibrio sp.]
MDSFFTFVTEPLAHEFMQRALLMSVLVASVCSIFSCFLVLKGWSLMGDAISHAVLPGLALAYLAGVPLMIGALLSGLTCAGVIGYIKDNCRVKEDAVMGIIFSGMFALGLVIITKIESDIHLMHILFGNVLGITWQDLLSAGVIAIICSAITLVKRKDLMLFCFDPVQANVLGLPIKFLHFGMLVLLALTIVSALKAAGIILVIAMLIIPGACGFVLARAFDKMMLIAVTTSIAACFIGTLLSFHMDVSTAPLIVVIQAGVFVTSSLYAEIRKRRSYEQVRS